MTILIHRQISILLAFSYRYQDATHKHAQSISLPSNSSQPVLHQQSLDVAQPDDDDWVEMDYHPDSLDGDMWVEDLADLVAG